MKSEVQPGINMCVTTVIILLILIMPPSECQSTTSTAQPSDQYALLERGHSLHCQLPAQQTESRMASGKQSGMAVTSDKDTAFQGYPDADTATQEDPNKAADKSCRWWQDGRLLPESKEYAVTVSTGGRCTLRIARVKEWDAAPTLYRCSAGENIPTDYVIRLWIKVQPNDPQLVAEGATITNNQLTLNLSSFTSDSHVTVTCRATAGRPVARLYWELDKRLVKSDPPAQVVPDKSQRSVFTAIIHLRIPEKESGSAGSVARKLKCFSQHLFYGKNHRNAELYIVGQYRSPLPAPTNNLVILGAVVSAIFLLIVFATAMLVLMKRKRARNREALAMSPLSLRPRPQPRRPLPSIRSPSENRDTYLVPTAVVGGQRRDAEKGGSGVVALPSDGKSESDHIYHEIGSGSTTENSYIIVF